MFGLFNRVFGCWHSNLSFPQTVRPGKRRSKAASLTGTYVVCLDCGEELPYDWKEMRIAKAGEKNGTIQERAQSA